MSQYLKIVLLCSVLFSCESEKVYIHNDTYKIVFAQGGCYGVCPAESFSIDSTLKIRYRGVDNVDRVGYFQGTISNDTWDTLQVLSKSNQDVHSDTCLGCIDAQIFEIHIYGKHGEQHLWGDHCCLPEGILALCKRLEDIAKNTLMAESYEFPLETNAHLPPAIVDTIPFQFTVPE